jgi:hypothetical protein
MVIRRKRIVRTKTEILEFSAEFPNEPALGDNFARVSEIARSEAENHPPKPRIRTAPALLKRAPH